MPRITSQSQLNVGVELIIDEPNRTIRLVEAGNLDFKAGVEINALYSKLVTLWNGSVYQDGPFPMTGGNVKAGDYQFGVDSAGATNGWKPFDDATRDALREGGWNEFDEAGNLLRVYSGFIGLGEVNTGAQPYYILESGDAPTDFPFDDQFDVGIQVFGDADNGDFDQRVVADTEAQAFVREQGQLYFSSFLGDTGSTIGPDIARFLISNRADDNIVAPDADMNDATFGPIDITYFDTDQLRDVGGTDFPFRVIVEGNGATLQQIYTKVQFLLRQDANINENSATASVLGRTADALMVFNGATLLAEQGVFIDNFDLNQLNDINLVDANGAARAFPFFASGNLTFSPNLVAGGEGTYRLFYDTPPQADSDYGTEGAITVNDAAGNPIAGLVDVDSISFSFDYDANTQGGFAGSTDRDIVLVAINPGGASHTTFRGTITRTQGLVFSLVGQTDNAYAA